MYASEENSEEDRDKTMDIWLCGCSAFEPSMMG